MKIASFSLILVLLILSFPLVFNLKAILGLGTSQFNEREEINFASGTGTVDIDMVMSFDDNVYISPLASFFNRFLFITIRTTGNLDSLGVKYLYYRSFIDGNQFDYEEEIWDPPINPQVTDLRVYSLNKYANYTIEGYVEVQFDDGGTIQNETISFIHTYIVQIADTDLFELEIATIWLEVIDIVVILVMIWALYRAIRGPVNYKYDEEMQRKDREYFEYLKQKRKQEEN